MFSPVPGVVAIAWRKHRAGKRSVRFPDRFFFASPPPGAARYRCWFFSGPILRRRQSRKIGPPKFTHFRPRVKAKSKRDDSPQKKTGQFHPLPLMIEADLLSSLEKTAIFPMTGEFPSLVGLKWKRCTLGLRDEKKRWNACAPRKRNFAITPNNRKGSTK